MRLIIACDEPPAARRLCSELSKYPAETICVTGLEELKSDCDSPCELALINVARAELVEYVRTIRESPSGANCSVLVASERLSSELGLAGILPILRAMPCLHGDMVKLAHRLITGGQEKERRRNLCPL
ncbi:MAG: hypothetical protein ACREEM_14580 [Blastocatellia bacterium]